MFTALGFISLYPKPAQYSPLKWSKLHNSLFISLSRPGFIGALMMLMTLMFTSQRNMLTRFFGHKWWLPLSRLTFGAYLLFPLCMSILLSSFKNSLVLSYYTMVALLSYAFVASFTASLVTYLLIE